MNNGQRPDGDDADLSAILGSMMNQFKLEKAAGRCPSCKLSPLASEFRDELSWREFGISGLCQKCQDVVFAPDDDEEV